MKRFFFATTFMIIAVGVGWRYAPPEARERMLGFIGMANHADPARIAQDIKDKITPEDPAARRAALVLALKQKIQEIQNSTGAKKSADQSGVPADAPASASVQDARAADIASSADEAAQLADQLEQAGGVSSSGGQIVQRVLERIFPATQCKEP